MKTMKSSAVLSCIFCVIANIHCGDALLTTELRVASFNIRHFGDTLMNREEEKIVKIFSNFDLVFVMETRDKDQSSVKKLIESLNANGEDWTFTMSGRLGRSIYYKEQYVFFYRRNAVNLLSTFQYDDVADDFEREPYSILIEYFSPEQGKNLKVAFTGIHVDPDFVEDELKALPAAMDAVKDHFEEEAIIAMGDFNADCTYLSQAPRQALAIFSDQTKYTSLISDDVDTTVSATDCAYDRVIVQGNVATSDAEVYDFEMELGLTYLQAYDLSDHFPVYFNLK